jgi:hypothetical protein
MHPAETGLLIPSGKRANRTSKVILYMSGYATYQDLAALGSKYAPKLRTLANIGNQKRASSVEVNRKQVQPVSLHTR